VLLALVAPSLGEDDRYIVALKKTISFDFAREYLLDTGVKIVLEQPDYPFFAIVTADAHALRNISGTEFVDYVEDDARRYPISAMPSSAEARAQAIEEAINSSLGADPQTTPYGIPMVQATLVSDSLAGGITVCIIDSGWDGKHEDLPATATGYNTGWNTDGCGHGTHVGGTIAAVNNNLGVIGVLPNSKVRIYIVKVFDNSCGWSYASGLADAATRCYNAGAKVISMSLGGPSATTTETNTFNDLFNTKNMLSVAAAGNDGTTAYSYPASLSSVISIGAVDDTGTWASFSQYNNQVELVAPGVSVLSTVPTGTGYTAFVYGGGNPGTLYIAYPIMGTTAAYNSPKLDTGYIGLCDCGEATSACTACSGKVCLVKRGTNTLAQKVTNCEAGGAKGAVIYNNVAGVFTGSLGTTTTKIPSATISLAAGQAMAAKLTALARVNVATSNYGYMDGTSMATPHASAVTALVWSSYTKCTNSQIRNALKASAKLVGGQTGFSNKYGYGLVQAKAAYDNLKTASC